MDAELSARVTSAARTYGRLHRVWRCATIHLSLKLLFYNAFVLPTLLYACETWTLTGEGSCTGQLQRLSVFHRDCMRRIKRLPLETPIPDLHASGCQTFEISDFIDQFRARFIGHLVRRDEDFLPSKMLFAHWFSTGPSTRPPGGALSSYCEATREMLARIGAKLGLDLSADTEFWLGLASCRVWWRANVVKGARKAGAELPSL